MEGIQEQTNGMRGTPDVSFCADPDYGVAIYHSIEISGSAGWGKAGGTSFAAPAWAAVLAGIRQREVRHYRRICTSWPAESGIWNLSRIFMISYKGKAVYIRPGKAGICVPA